LDEIGVATPKAILDFLPCPARLSKEEKKQINVIWVSSDPSPSSWPGAPVKRRNGRVG